jgi:uncharacterized membrane protein
VNGLLWILQLLLALAFVALGLLKLTRPRETLLRTLPWVEDFPQPVVKALGAVEVLGGLVLVIPAGLGFGGRLVPVAAIGLALVALGAVVTHVLRSERDRAAVPAVLLLGSVAVAAGRLGGWPL